MDKNDIIEGLKQNNYYISKGFIDLEEYTQCRNEAISYFKNIDSSRKKMPNAVRGDINAGQKNSLGYTSNNSWKIYRDCIFPWNREPKELQSIVKLSRKISEYRNSLFIKNPNYGSVIEDNGYFNYTSLSLYPPNGGFLEKHQDVHPDQEGEIPLLHFKIELTHRSKDYISGGFYIWNKEDKEICISSIVEPGDVIFFYGKASHEIKPVQGGIGRIALFEIPSYVNENSREPGNISYSKQRNLKTKIKNKIHKAYKFFRKK